MFSSKYSTNIAIIDSGIDTNNSDFRTNVIGGVSFEYDTQRGCVFKTIDYQDENGHGTSCASIIKREVEDVGLFIIKILNKDCLTHSKALIEALKFLLHTDVRLVNLSVATTNELYHDELKEVCELLYRQGKILVCSLDNRYDSSFPAVFENVIGVRGKNFNCDGCFWYNSKYTIQCISDNLPVLAPTINNTYRLFGKNSKATPLMTGRIAKILMNKPNISFEELGEILEQNAIKRNWTEEELFTNSILVDEILEERYLSYEYEMKTLADIIANTYGMDRENIKLLYENQNLRNPKIGMNILNCYDLIRNIEKEFNIKLNYNLINLYTLSTLYSLLDFIIEEMNLCSMNQIKKV